MLSTPLVNDQLETPSILLHWYLVKVPLPSEQSNLHTIQAVFALFRMQSTLQVNDQRHCYSILVQFCNLILFQMRNSLNRLPYLHCFPTSPKSLSTLPMNDQLATPSTLLRWYLVKVPLPPELNSLHSMHAVFAPSHL